MELLSQAAYKTIIVVGDADSGKTSLVASLATTLKVSNLALVDSDLGQSRIGPPSTVAWGKAPPGKFSWDEVAPIDFYFVGATSAVGNLLPTLVAVKKMTDLARSAAEKVIVDTSGLVRGPGVVLKQHKIDLIEPDAVIALQHRDELEPILEAYAGRTRPLIVRLPVPKTVKRKSLESRTHWREQQLRRYFQDATKHQIPLRKLGVRNGPLSFGDIGRQPSWQLICLESKLGKHLALGLICGLNVKAKRLTILTPLKAVGEIGGVIFSRLRIDPSGRQLSRR